MSYSRDGWGEIAPLPGFSEETLDQTQEQAIEWLTTWCNASCDAPRVPLDGTYPLLLLVSVAQWMK